MFDSPGMRFTSRSRPVSAVAIACASAVSSGTSPGETSWMACLLAGNFIHSHALPPCTHDSFDSIVLFLLYPVARWLVIDGKKALSAGEAEKAIVETSVAFLGFRCFATFACMLVKRWTLSNWVYPNNSAFHVLSAASIVSQAPKLGLIPHVSKQSGFCTLTVKRALPTVAHPCRSAARHGVPLGLLGCILCAQQPIRP